MNNTNAYTEPLPMFEGEQTYFTGLGFTHVGGKTGSRARRESRVDAWVRKYPAQPADIRMTIQRPKLVNAPWEVYGVLQEFPKGPSENIFLKMERWCDTFRDAGAHIDDIAETLRQCGVDVIARREKQKPPARPKPKNTGMRKLSYEQAEEIRAQYQQGHRQVDLAEAYGVAPTTIVRILDGTNYKHRESSRTTTE